MMNQLLITDLLERINLNVAIAENGRQALDMLARENYDLILLDMQMPVMDGMETVTRIRADENLKNIPVIALTANALKGDAEKYIKAGCDDYLPKPIKFAKFYDKIGAIIAVKTQKDKVT
jgi:CheY-like chemotaxis protein